MYARPRAWLAATLLIAGAAHAGTFDRLIADVARDPAMLECATEFLEELGWTIEQPNERAEPSGRPPEIASALPCDWNDLDAAKRGEKLVVRSSRPLGANDIAAVLASDGTRCLFGLKVGEATRRATEKLAANEGYRFTGLQLGWIKLDGNAWLRRDRFGRRFEPRVSNSVAIAQFTERGARSDCGVGRQVAQYATLAELFGDDFDRAFSRDEIVVGTFNKLQRSNSVLLGRHRGELEADGLAKRASSRGRHALAGLPGFLYAVDADALSDTANQAQNFVVVEVSREASEALRHAKGFARYNAQIRDVWQSAQRIGDLGNRGYERLFVRRETRAWQKLDDAQRAIAESIAETLADPFFRSFVVYVHPKGIKPIGYHVVRMLDRNFGTPYRIELALHNVYGEIFARYADTKIRRCAAIR